MLNPGNKGLLGPILEKAQDENLYVRGVLNNFPAQGKDSRRSAATPDQRRPAAGLQGQADRGCDPARRIDKTADWWSARSRTPESS